MMVDLEKRKIDGVEERPEEVKMRMPLVS